MKEIKKKENIENENKNEKDKCDIKLVSNSNMDEGPAKIANFFRKVRNTYSVKKKKQK